MRGPTHTQEFNHEAARLFRVNGHRVNETTKDLGIARSSLLDDRLANLVLSSMVVPLIAKPKPLSVS